jgi:phosphatidylserine/phosphatidylglycerophosphate/cardiolipin synthase-like enzyme
VTQIHRSIADLCRSLAPTHVEQLACGVEGLGPWSAGQRQRVLGQVAAPHRILVGPLLDAWAAEPELTGIAVATGLRAASSAIADPTIAQIEVVCTGPSSDSTPVRFTSEVVCQLIDRATSHVLIVSYAAYTVPRVIEALDAASTRGVAITLVLESPEKLKNASLGKYTKYPVYVWPMSERPPNASLHAKVVSVDGKSVLLTSANLTQAAYDQNIELGVLVHGGTAASEIEAHFFGLVAQEILVSL